MIFSNIGALLIFKNHINLRGSKAHALGMGSGFSSGSIEGISSNPLDWLEPEEYRSGVCIVRRMKVI